MLQETHLCCSHWKQRLGIVLPNGSTIGRYSLTSTICHGWHVGIKRSTYDEEKAPASLMQTSLASLPNRISSMMVLHCQENILNPWASECICTSQGSNDVEISTLLIWFTSIVLCTKTCIQCTFAGYEIVLMAPSRYPIKQSLCCHRRL